VFPLKDNIPTLRFPIVTVTLIAMNVAVYLWSIRNGGSLFGGPASDVVFDYGFIPYEASHPGEQCILLNDQVGCGKVSGQPPLALTALSSMFMHGGLLHIAGNMIFLWVFGNNVEDSMGRLKFVVFYLGAGLAALVGQYLVGQGEPVPLVGASGAVAGVLGGYILLYPRARVVTLVFIIFLVTIIELPAIFFLGFWFLQQLAFGAAGLTDPVGDAGGVAYFAHIGGFVFGIALIKLFADRVKTGYDGPRYPVY
jgi:membrane associated rhomboid family serine protease